GVQMLEELCDTYYEAMTWGLMEVRVFGRATGELADTLTRRASEQIGGINARLEHELGERQYFNGSSFGWGDISVFPHVQGAAAGGFAPREGSRLGKWLEQMRERDSVRKCVGAAARIFADPSQLQQV